MRGYACSAWAAKILACHRAHDLDLWLVAAPRVRLYSWCMDIHTAAKIVYGAPVTTFNGHAPVMCNADTWIHLAALDTELGARRSLCAYTAPQLREATRRDLNVNPDMISKRGFCPTCRERAGL